MTSKPVSNWGLSCSSNKTCPYLLNGSTWRSILILGVIFECWFVSIGGCTKGDIHAVSQLQAVITQHLNLPRLTNESYLLTFLRFPSKIQLNPYTIKTIRTSRKQLKNKNNKPRKIRGPQSIDPTPINAGLSQTQNQKTWPQKQKGLILHSVDQTKFLPAQPDYNHMGINKPTVNLGELTRG